MAWPLQQLRLEEGFQKQDRLLNGGDAMTLYLADEAAFIMVAAPVLTSSGQEARGQGLLALLFLGFGSLVLLCQLIPVFVLVYAMLKGLFNGAATTSVPQANSHIKTAWFA